MHTFPVLTALCVVHITTRLNAGSSAGAPNLILTACYYGSTKQKHYFCPARGCDPLCLRIERSAECLRLCSSLQFWIFVRRGGIGTPWTRISHPISTNDPFTSTPGPCTRRPLSNARIKMQNDDSPCGSIRPNHIRQRHLNKFRTLPPGTAGQTAANEDRAMC